MEDIKSPSSITIGELTRIVREFEEKIQNGTEDPEETYTNCVNLHHYITMHRDHINYPEYKEKGYFCGSGAIESGRWEQDVVDHIKRHLSCLKEK